MFRQTLAILMITLLAVIVQGMAVSEPNVDPRPPVSRC